MENQLQGIYIQFYTHGLWIGTFLHPPCTMDNITVTAFHHAWLTMQLGMVKFMSKWWNNTLATGVILQQCWHWIYNRCPWCNDWGEDCLHVLLCWDSKVKIIRQKYLDTHLHQLLVNTSTHSDIISFIMEGLSQFFRQPHQNEEDRHNEQWKEEQKLIGWCNFISGFIGKALVAKQRDH